MQLREGSGLVLFAASALSWPLIRSGVSLSDYLMGGPSPQGREPTEDA